MGLRDVDREPPSWSMKLSLMPLKRKLCQYGDVVAEKWRTASNLGSRTRSVGFGSSSSKFSLYKDTASNQERSCLSTGDRQPLVYESLPSVLLITQLLITDGEKTKEAVGCFSLAGSEDTPDYLFWLRLRWALVRSARESKDLPYVMKLSFQVRASSRGSGGAWRSILYLKLFLHFTMDYQTW